MRNTKQKTRFVFSGVRVRWTKTENIVSRNKQCLICETSVSRFAKHLAIGYDEQQIGQLESCFLDSYFCFALGFCLRVCGYTNENAKQVRNKLVSCFVFSDVRVRSALVVYC